MQATEIQPESKTSAIKWGLNTYEGSQAQVIFNWQLDAHSHFQINYLHFFVGGYLKDTSPVGKGLDFVTTSISIPLLVI